MHGGVGVRHRRAEPEPAVRRLPDLVLGEPAYVDEELGRLDPESHEIDEIRAAAEELGLRLVGDERDRARGIVRALVAERPHARAASRTAATMFTYAPQRQRLPLMRSRISSSVSSTAPSGVTALGRPAATSSRRATAEQIWPGVQ